MRAASQHQLSRRGLLTGAIALAAYARLPAVARADALSPALRNRATGQMRRPGLPRLDRSHPLAQGLEFYGIDAGNGLPVDLVSGRAGTIVPATSLSAGTPTQWGQSTRYNGAGAFFASTARIQAVTAAGNWTMSVGYLMASFQGIPFSRSANNGGSQPFFNWGIENTAANTNSFHWNSGGTLTSFAWASAQLNTFTTQTMVVPGTATVLSYAQGALVNTAAGQTIQSANTNDALVISGNSSAGNVGGMNGNTFYGAFWSRPLSAAEALQLHLDPYCFLIFPDDETQGPRR